MTTWTAKLKDKNISITGDELNSFREMYVAKGDLSSRMSNLLWVDIYVLDMHFGVSALEILKSIKDLEAGETAGGIKPATMFKNAPLRGLWHKHYFSAHFLVDNLLLGLGKNGLERLVNEVMDPSKSAVNPSEMIEELAHRVAHEPVEERHKQGKLTGEWIVFAKNGGKNFYLCLNTHSAGDQFIYDRIMQNCVKDFPDLANWIAHEANK